MSLQGGLAIERMCFLAGISRAGFYRHFRAQDPREEEMAVRSEVQRIALENLGRYGYRRITAELRRQGMPVNHKRVARLMREDNLVGTESQQCLDDLTEPRDRGEIYVNLANRMKLTGPNQVWVADITFVRLRREFVYLAVVLDKFSRKVVGWNLDRTLTARLPLAALGMALESRSPVTGLVHHSDRGAQYAHAEYLRTLRNHGVIPSVSRLGCPYDNGNCERFFRTLKQEEINTREYRDLEDLRLHIADFIDRYYNQKRLHSALGYLTPTEFERTNASSDAASIADIAQIKI
jgi:putative transposase